MADAPDSVPFMSLWELLFRMGVPPGATVALSPAPIQADDQDQPIDPPRP